tara:strand:- start:1384 stop:1542 length:159 start_codon:yes stop_codon:yes gene_type:complete
MEKMTTISTTYARVAIILLALNFVFTGYAITKLVNLEDSTVTPQQVETNEIE